MADIADPIIPSLDEVRATFKRGFLEWSSHVQTAAKAAPRALIDHLRLIETAFPDHPGLPGCIDIKDLRGSLSATGSSSWAATTASSGHEDLAQFRQSHEITVTTFKPRTVRLTAEPDSDYSNWFGGQGCHITILMFAWAYVLSSRWTEIIPGAGPIRYTESRPASVPGHEVLAVHLGGVSGDAARWWEAVLAPRQGWLATVNSGSEVLYSPWSIRLPSSPRFRVDYSESAPSTGSTATFRTALRYLDDYCVTYDLADQSRAALAAALFLPLDVFSGRCVRLSMPRESKIAPKFAAETPRREESRGVCSTSQLDKLLTLSCNIRGMLPILFSLFFDREVPYNLASPWLQGIFSALDTVSSDRYMLAGTLTQRDPRLGFLWVGAIVSGCHTQLLRRARHDCMEVDILSAMWTNTLQTFIQLPVTGLVQFGRIERENECRLLYLGSKSYQCWPPMSPWKPFGSTALEDTDLDVRLHAHCQGHGLKYVGWEWDCWIDGRQTQMAVPASRDASNTYSGSKSHLIANDSTCTIPYDDMDPDDEGPSWKATLNIFMWLRRDGFPSSEQCIRRHDWLREVLDDDEAEAYESWTDEEDVVTSGRRRAKSSAPKPRLGWWLASSQGRRRRST